MLDEFALPPRALARLATVVRAAAITPRDIAAEAAAPPALAAGVSRRCRDDQDQLQAGLPLCDARNRWPREGAQEGHDRSTGRGQ